MPSLSNNFDVEIDGSSIPADVDLHRVVVDDHLLLPDSFEITFRDAARQAISKTSAAIGSKVTVSVYSGNSSSPQQLITGEITALEAEVYGATSYTIMRGYDESHRLTRGRVTATYLNMSYSDIARKVADRNSLGVDTIDDTDEMPHVSQANEDDLTFLWRMANDVGFEVSVTDEKLSFRQPVTDDDAPASGNLTDDDSRALNMGGNLLSLRASVTSAQQVKQVEVRGWDPAGKQAVVATADATTDTANNGSSPDQLAATFPAPNLVSVSVPYREDANAQSAADGLAAAVASGFTEMEGHASGNPELFAGSAVRVNQVGDPFDGTYVLTSTRHTYDPDEGYLTSFVISGRQERSLFELANGVGETTSVTSGVVPAVVDDVDDPESQGRVRLRFPWLDDDYVSDWSRTIHAGAGDNRGFLVLPEVGDEVLVAFEHDDVRCPYVLGGLYNGQDSPLLGPGDLLDDSTHAVNQRVWSSRVGHQVVLVDGDDGCGIVLTTGDGSMTLTLDQSQSKVTLQGSGDLEFTLDGDVTLQAGGSLTLQGSSVDVQADSDLTLEGAQISVQGSGPVQVEGQPIQLN